MARRLDKTLVDYLVIAISPMLIIVLIASLVYFLLEVFYHGPFDGRLRYILGLFVIGAVLVARISIEEDRERASLFAIPLALAIVVAIVRFVELSFLANCGLIALIWWCADKLTWDCTLIDETAPDSGEGLMQAVGLDAPASRQALLAPPRPEPESATARDTRPTDLRERAAGWWARFREHRRRPHAPGLWVVYFSLAALPLFGIGQLFIPASNVASRQFAFELLFVYVASGLALLLATSFLGLRRYLRQRRLEMPLLMVNVWLLMGCALIAGVMIFTLLLPRPNAEYAISQMPFRISSPERKSSPYGLGRDGVKEDQPWARTNKIDEKGSRQSNQPGDKGQTPSDQQGNQGAGQSGQKQGQQPGQSQAQPGTQNQAQAGKPDSARRGSPDPAETADRQVSPGQRRPSGEAVARSGDRPQREGDRPQREGDRPQRGESQPQRGETPPQGGDKQPQRGDKQPQRGETQPQRGDKQPQREESRREQSPENAGSKSAAKTESEQNGDAKSAQSKQEPSEKQGEQEKPSATREPGSPSGGSRSWPQMPQFSVSAVGGWFAALAKVLFYVALMVLVAYGLWRYWPTVVAAIRDFFQGLAEFWRSLFGGGRQRPEEAAAPATPVEPAPARFADFVDPFLSGRVNRYTPAQLVSYTFHALEAWAREHGCPRRPEETPHEFAQNVGLRSAPLAAGARRLAELYCQLAYASGRLPASSVEQLRQLWQSF